MELDNIKLQTTWNDAAGSINNNFLKLKQAIATLIAEGGGLDEEQLVAYLQANGYTTEQWIALQEFIKLGSLDTEIKADSVNAVQNKAIKSYVDRVDAAIRGALNLVDGRITAIEDYFSSEEDADTLINKWNEIVAFLNATEGTTLDNILSSKADKVEIPTRVSQLENDKEYITSAAIANKVDKEEGKGLSSNDYTDAEKSKLAAISVGAEANVQSDWLEFNSNRPEYIKNKTHGITNVQNAIITIRPDATTKGTNLFEVYTDVPFMVNGIPYQTLDMVNKDFLVNGNIGPNVTFRVVEEGGSYFVKHISGIAVVDYEYCNRVTITPLSEIYLPDTIARTSALEGFLKSSGGTLSGSIDFGRHPLLSAGAEFLLSLGGATTYLKGSTGIWLETPELYTKRDNKSYRVLDLGMDINARTLGGLAETAFYRSFRAYISVSDLDTYVSRDVGAYSVVHSGHTSALLVLSKFTGGSNTSVEIYAPSYNPSLGLRLRFGIDSNRYSDWRDFAFLDDTIYAAYKLVNSRGDDIVTINSYNNVIIGASGADSANYKLYVDGDIRAKNAIKIGEAIISWDNELGALKIVGNVYATGQVAAGGFGNSEGGSGGGVILDYDSVVAALGFTPFDSAAFTKISIQNALGIADWALAANKPSYNFSEIGSKPTTLSGYGITDALELAPAGEHRATTDYSAFATYAYADNGWRSSGPALAFPNGSYKGLINIYTGNGENNPPRMWLGGVYEGTQQSWVEVLTEKSQGVMQARGRLAEADADTLSEAGVYEFWGGGAISNVPSGYSTMLVSRGVDNNLYFTSQLLTDAQGHLYSRMSEGYTLNWRPWRTILDDNNISSYAISQSAADSRYLKLTGGTISGSIVVLGDITTQNELRGKPISNPIKDYVLSQWRFITSGDITYLQAGTSTGDTSGNFVFSGYAGLPANNLRFNASTIEFSGSAIEFSGSATAYGPLNVTGNISSGAQICIHNDAYADKLFRSKCSAYEIGFGIGAGNVNRGIFDFTNSQWWIVRGSGIDTSIYGDVNIDGLLTANRGIRVASGQALSFIDAGGTEHSITYDSAANAFKVDGSMYALGQLAAGEKGEEHKKVFDISSTATSTEYVITHNFQTYEVSVAVYKVTPATGSTSEIWTQVIVDIEITSADSIKVSFYSKPSNTAYKVVVIG